MNNIFLIPILPLFSAFILGILYILNIKVTKVSDTVISIVSLIAPVIVTILSIYLFFTYDGISRDVTLFRWLDTETLKADISFRVDTLSIYMSLFITFISTLIVLYSIGYMKGDEYFGKFFVYLNLFISSMLFLVLADNPFLMFFGWEGVGFSSYLLISFYYKDIKNASAGSKAFIVNRVGDFFFLIGLSTLVWQYGFDNFNFTNIASHIYFIHMYDMPAICFIAFCLFIGATAKSAQIPLYTWLPDAMAGPTPVSALIHAATMVTAGLYMVARFSFIYNVLPDVGSFITFIGGVSAIFAAIIATRQSDIKKILAYSTMSQLGYMFMAMGIGDYSAGLFHVLSHAFFKATLFLGAGGVIILLCHEQNIFKMGNLKNNRLLYFVMLIATLSISGIPPFAGFFSKDEIMYQLFITGNYKVYALSLITAGITSYYMFRMFFLVFHGNDKADHKVHHVPTIMKVVLVILSIGVVFIGFLGMPDVLGPNLVKEYLSSSLYTSDRHFKGSHSLEIKLMCLNVFIALIGIFIAYLRFYKFSSVEFKENKLSLIIKNKFYIDEIYNYIFVRSINKTSRGFNNFNIYIINNIVCLAGYITSYISKYYEKLFQDGKIKTYLFIMTIVMSAIILYTINFELKG